MEQLDKIQEGLNQEKFSTFEDVKVRIDQLNEYMKLFNEVYAKVVELSKAHKKEVLDVLAEKASIEKKISDAKVDHMNLVKGHDSIIAGKEIHLVGLTQHVHDKELKANSIDNRIQGLIVEQKAADERLTELRGTIAVTERSISALREEEYKLKKSIADKQPEEARILSSIEDSKKIASRLSSDIAVLEARLNK